MMTESDDGGLKQIEELLARRRRVIVLLNAIRALRAGDLQAVIDLDTIAPMEIDEGPASWDTNEARTGAELAGIFEDRLQTMLAVGIWGKLVPSYNFDRLDWRPKS
jgi:hypothetical protein